MKQSKISTQEIAEIIIERFSEMQGYTQRIESAVNQPLTVDVSGLKKETAQFSQIVAQQNKAETQILSNLKAIGAQNKTRVPNWVIALLGAMFITTSASLGYALSKAEDYEMDKYKAQYWEQEYNTLKASTINK